MFCACGCGGLAPVIYRKYIYGHSNRGRVKKNPKKDNILCGCGCGAKTKGYSKYIRGHHLRKKP